MVLVPLNLHRRSCDKVVTQSNLLIPQAGASSDSTKAKGRSLGDRCAICGNKVYLLERHIQDGQLYHRSCFRHSDLSPTNKVYTRSPFLSPSLHGKEGGASTPRDNVTSTPKSPQPVLAVGNRSAGDSKMGVEEVTQGHKRPATDSRGDGASKSKSDAQRTLSFGESKNAEKQTYKAMLPAKQFDAKAYEKHSEDLLSAEKDVTDVKSPKRQLPLIFQAADKNSDVSNDKTSAASEERTSVSSSAVSEKNTSISSSNVLNSSSKPSLSAGKVENKTTSVVLGSKVNSSPSDSVKVVAQNKPPKSSAMQSTLVEDKSSQKAVSGTKLKQKPTVTKQPETNAGPVAKPRQAAKKLTEEPMDTSEVVQNKAQPSVFPTPARRRALPDTESDKSRTSRSKSPLAPRKPVPRPRSPARDLSPEPPSSPPPLPSSAPPPLPLSAPPAFPLPSSHDLPSSPELSPRDLPVSTSPQPSSPRSLPSSSNPLPSPRQPTTSDSVLSPSKQLPVSVSPQPTPRQSSQSVGPCPSPRQRSVSPLAVKKSAEDLVTKDPTAIAGDSVRSEKPSQGSAIPSSQSKASVERSSSSSKSVLTSSKKSAASGLTSSHGKASLVALSNIKSVNSASDAAPLESKSDSKTSHGKTSNNTASAVMQIASQTSTHHQKTTPHVKVSDLSSSTQKAVPISFHQPVSVLGSSQTSSSANGGSMSAEPSSLEEVEPMDVDTAVSKARSLYGEEPVAVMVVPVDKQKQEKTIVSGLLKSLAHIRHTPLTQPSPSSQSSSSHPASSSKAADYDSSTVHMSASATSEFGSSKSYNSQPGDHGSKNMVRPASSSSSEKDTVSYIGLHDSVKEKSDLSKSHNKMIDRSSKISSSNNELSSRSDGMGSEPSLLVRGKQGDTGIGQPQANNKVEEDPSKLKAPLLPEAELKDSGKPSERIPLYKKKAPRSPKTGKSNSHAVAQGQTDIPATKPRPKSAIDSVGERNLSVANNKTTASDTAQSVKLRESGFSLLERKDKARSAGSVFDRGSGSKPEWQLDAERRMAVFRDNGFVDPEARKLSTRSKSDSSDSEEDSSVKHEDGLVTPEKHVEKHEKKHLVKHEEGLVGQDKEDLAKLDSTGKSPKLTPVRKPLPVPSGKIDSHTLSNSDIKVVRLDKKTTERDSLHDSKVSVCEQPKTDTIVESERDVAEGTKPKLKGILKNTHNSWGDPPPKPARLSDSLKEEAENATAEPATAPEPARMPDCMSSTHLPTKQEGISSAETPEESELPVTKKKITIDITGDFSHSDSPSPVSLSPSTPPSGSPAPSAGDEGAPARKKISVDVMFDFDINNSAAAESPVSESPAVLEMTPTAVPPLLKRTSVCISFLSVCSSQFVCQTFVYFQAALYTLGIQVMLDIMCMCLHMCMHTRTCIHVCILHAICMRACVCVLVCACTCVLCMHLCVCMCVCVCVKY